MNNNDFNIVADDGTVYNGYLFHWNSSINKDVKLKMIHWYNALSPEEQQYVDNFRNEAAMMEYDTHCGPEY